jgi:hypothetical protein
MDGQYGGPLWPTCDHMPTYEITGGPVIGKDEHGNHHLIEGPMFTARKINECGNNMMAGSPKVASARTNKLPAALVSGDSSAVNAGSVPGSRGTFLVRASDHSRLFVSASEGLQTRSQQALDGCSDPASRGNCEWELIPSSTRPGAYYLKAAGADLYMHARGGSKVGAKVTLHPCPRSNNHGNCQWYIQPSFTRPGAFYIKVSDAELYLHSHGGTRSGAQQTLHPCPRSNNHANCQWVSKGFR